MSYCNCYCSDFYQIRGNREVTVCDNVTNVSDVIGCHQMSSDVTYLANVTDVSHKSDEFSKACGEVLDRFQFRSVRTRL